MTNAILTCSEHFSALALNELRRHHPQLDCKKQLSPQHHLIHIPASFDTLTRPWRHKLPIYLHHLFPVHQTVNLRGDAQDFARIRRKLMLLQAPDATLQIRVMDGYRYDADKLMQALAPDQVVLTSAHDPRRVMSVLVTPRKAYLGVSWASQNISPYIMGIPPLDEPVANRAGLKLLEALATFGIQLDPAWHALDLGAAPGAWTEVLRRRGLRVTAVAPRAMYPWLVADPMVEAFDLTAEEYLGQCATVYDVLLNDMRLDARSSARMMVGYARFLRPDAIALMTLKLRMHEPQRLMDHTYRLLRRAYKILTIRQLVANRKEVTLFLRRKDISTPQSRPHPR